MSPATIRTVKATAPILRERGLEITRRLYEILFQNEEIKSLFNQAHHSQEGSQPRALAGAVHAFADNIDRLDEYVPMIERITQKHVGLNIRPEHYPYVGRALIGALIDVLGEAATEDVIAAWTQAYDFLAYTLMSREHELYEVRALAPGGWVGWRDFAVERIVSESETVKSFYLRPADSGPLMAFQPGQYLTVRFDIPGHGPVTRNYSISSAPQRDHYRISVKREDPPEEAPYAPPGLASHYLHGEVSVGRVVRVSPPAGDFYLDEASHRPVALLSGGVGLTPVLSMLEYLVEHDAPREIWFVHATRCGREHAMKRHVRDLAAAYTAVHSVVFYTNPMPEDVLGRDYDLPGRITMEWLKGELAVVDLDFYFCGPEGFMRMLAIGLRALDVPDERIHFEFFGPAEALYA
ncbi:NO-inducible flavohemoprotein [Planosporangium flavigriseum]|uniref:Flavohemoprotein n=1 Tax=Planosporangium flavigriseum TaxID=373681 RepID=A0A8J3PNR4_9ACTN|nr:NO-inducible flavohemoprotein [Planosporangium flavigriseum]GIG75619.1 flavohemoprotein [Planosporangium flavigriseum]